MTVPKDLSHVKTIFLFNLTKRQVLCFGCGILAGLLLFFLLRPHIPASAAALIMIVVMMPFFLFWEGERIMNLWMYRKSETGLDKVL